MNNLAINNLLAIDGISENECHKMATKENGTFAVTITGKEDKGEIILPKEQGELIVNIDIYRNLSQMSTMAIAYHLSLVTDDMLERLAYKSVKQFAVDFCGLSSSTVNQYIRIGEYIEYTAGGGYQWKYDFMKGASVTNINQCLSFIEKNGIEKFREAVENGDIAIKSSLSRVKKDLAALKKGIIEDGEEPTAEPMAEPTVEPTAETTAETTAEKSLQETLIERLDALSTIAKTSGNTKAVNKFIAKLADLEKIVAEL